MSAVLGKLNPHGLAPEWFKIFVAFLNSLDPSSAYPLGSSEVGYLSFLDFDDFTSVCNHLSQVSSDNLSVYTDESLKNLGTAGCKAGTAVFFENISLGLGIGVLGLMSSTMVELQAIALVLECISMSNSVHLFSNSQSVLDACKLELGLMCSDFCNKCWVKCQHIVNVIYSKNLRISWHKVKSYSGISGNKHVNVIANAATLSCWYFPLCLDERFIVADDSVIFGNSRHFVCDIYCSVCHACWEIGSGSKFLMNSLILEVDWLCSSLV
ncbi:hypothetical protein G9A89_020920 [Geosiphon pyriformis]|nr:hypothetical protein G9A89_020920 [Geosiphon pyriformis]